MPQLIFYLEKDYPQVHDLLTDKISIGRNKDNDIIVKDACVSVYHAELRKEKDGNYHVKDLGSHNGTVVNGMPMDESVLKDGDKVKFGVIKAMFLDRGVGANSSAGGKNGKPSPELQKEIDSKSDKLAKLEEAIKARSGMLATLQANKSKLEDLEKSSSTLKLQAEQGSTQLKALQGDLKTAQDKKVALQTGIKEQENKLIGLRREHEQLTSSMESSRKQKETFEADLGKVRKEIEESKAELAKTQELSEKAASVTEELKAKEARLGELNKSSGELEAQVSEREAARAKVGEEIDQAKIELGKHNTELEQANEALTKATAELEQSTAQRDKIAEELQQVSAELEAKKQESAEATAVIEEANSIKDKIEELKAEQVARQATAEDLAKQIAENESAAADLGKQLEEKSGSLEVLAASLAEKEQTAADLEAKVTENNSILDAFGDKVAKMEAALESGIADLNKSQETQKALLNDSQSLTQLISEKSGVLEHLKEKIYAKQYETEIATVCPPLRVIKPDMRSLVHYFHHAAGVPDQDKVDPVGFYGLAACTKGSVHREVDTVPQGEDPVLILLQADWEQDAATIAHLAQVMPGRILLVCWAEGQLEALFEGQEKDAFVDHLKGFLTSVAGIISTDGRTAKLLDDFDLGLPHLNVPLPCPVDSEDWNLPEQNPDRSRGIFLSTNEFDPESDLHRSRLEMVAKIAEQAQTAVTLYPESPELVEALNLPESSISVLTEPMRYSQYLATVRDHYLVAGMGSNEYGGNIVGDAILGKAIYVGGDNSRAIEELLFPDFCIIANDIDTPIQQTTLLLNDRNSFFEAIEKAEKMANYLFAFETVSDRVNEFVHFIISNR